MSLLLLFSPLLIFLSDGNVESAAGELKWHVDDWLVEIDPVCTKEGGGAGMLGEEEPEIDAAEAGRGVEPRWDRSPLRLSAARHSRRTGVDR